MIGITGNDTENERDYNVQILNSICPAVEEQ